MAGLWANFGGGGPDSLLKLFLKTWLCNLEESVCSSSSSNSPTENAYCARKRQSSESVAVGRLAGIRVFGELRRPVFGNVAHGLMSARVSFQPSSQTNSRLLKVSSLESYLCCGNDFSGKVTSLDPRPHVLHDLGPRSAIDVDDVSEPRERLLVLLVERGQLLRLGLGIVLEAGLLGDRLRRLDVLVAQARVGAEDGQQDRVRLRLGGSGGERQQLDLAGVDQVGVGSVDGRADHRQEGCVDGGTGLEQQVEDLGLG